MSKKAMTLALEALGITMGVWGGTCAWHSDVKSAIKALEEALAKQEQKYRRGDRLVCLETDEFCVIHISGIDRQWVKFPDSYIGVYTNEQIADMFELLAKEKEQGEPVALAEYDAGSLNDYGGGNVGWWWDYIRCELGRAHDHYQEQVADLYTTPQQRTWVGLDEDLAVCGDEDDVMLARYWERVCKEKNGIAPQGSDK